MSHGTVAINTAGVITIATAAQKTVLTNALNFIEAKLRGALVGTVFILNCGGRGCRASHATSGALHKAAPGLARYLDHMR